MRVIFLHLPSALLPFCLPAVAYCSIRMQWLTDADASRRCHSLLWPTSVSRHFEGNTHWATVSTGLYRKQPPSRPTPPHCSITAKVWQSAVYSQRPPEPSEPTVSSYHLCGSSLWQKSPSDDAGSVVLFHSVYRSMVPPKIWKCWVELWLQSRSFYSVGVSGSGGRCSKLKETRLVVSQWCLECWFTVTAEFDTKIRALDAAANCTEIFVSCGTRFFFPPRTGKPPTKLDWFLEEEMKVKLPSPPTVRVGLQYTGNWGSENTKCFFQSEKIRNV